MNADFEPKVRVFVLVSSNMNKRTNSTQRRQVPKAQRRAKTARKPIFNRSNDLDAMEKAIFFDLCSLATLRLCVKAARPSLDQYTYFQKGIW